MSRAKMASSLVMKLENHDTTIRANLLVTFHIENTCYMLNKKLPGEDKNIFVVLLPSENNWVCLLGHNKPRDHFVYAPGQWETTLQCNVVSHWLGTFTKWSLHTIYDTVSYSYKHWKPRVFMMPTLSSLVVPKFIFIWQPLVKPVM